MPARSAVSRDATKTAPKMNKAELEIQLTKLDRRVARLREQNKKLKVIVKAAGTPGESEPAAKSSPTVVKQASMTRAVEPRMSKAARPSEATEDDLAPE